MRNLLLLFVLSIFLNTKAQLPSSPPISLQDIRDERGGAGTTTIQTEASLWFAQTGKSKFDFPTNGSISIQDWLGESFDSGILLLLTQPASPSITIQEASGGGDVIVDWGDGTTDTYIGGITSSVTHNYSIQQTHNIIISSTFSLITFSCNLNSLTSIDVSNNTSLSFLACNDNSLTSIDVSNNTSLSSLNCGNNAITSIDVSNNTSLSDLRCPVNNSTSLILPLGNTLTFLDCNNNSLTSIDLTNKTNLTDLDISNNLITTITLPTSMDQIKFLSCDFNQISSTTVNSLLIFADNSVQIPPASFDSRNQTPLASPTGAGITAKNNLIAKGWSVFTD